MLDVQAFTEKDDYYTAAIGVILFVIGAVPVLVGEA